MCPTSSGLLCQVKEFITGRLHTEPLTFGLLLLLFCSSVTCISLCGMICCYNRYRSHSTSPSKAARKRHFGLEAASRSANGGHERLTSSSSANNIHYHHHSKSAQHRSVSNMSRRRLLNLMLARMEEFESLTPLMLTPTSTASNSIQLKAAAKENGGSKTKFLPGGRSHRPSPSPSPSAATPESSPPPLTRRLFAPVPGKTTIVPLTASNTRRTPLPPTVAIAISSSRQSAGLLTLARIESGRAATSVTNKSCETIPEGDETVSGNGANSTSQVDDLLSIDRTYVSVLVDSATSGGGQQPAVDCVDSASDGAVVQAVQAPLSSYSPQASLRPSPTTSYSSRNDAEAIGGSPVDETNSFISGSFVNYPLECGPCSAMTATRQQSQQQQVVSDLSSSILDCEPRYSLHMIEEESSEVASGSRATGVGGVNNSATMVTILERGGYSSQQQQFIPRSISQQLEMMNLN